MTTEDDVVQEYLTNLQLKILYQWVGYRHFLASVYGCESRTISSECLLSQQKLRDWCLNATGKAPMTVERRIFELAIDVALKNAKESKKENKDA